MDDLIDQCIIGTATRGYQTDAPVALSLDDRRRHLYVIGKTGVGKTTLLRTLIYDDLAAGRNFAVLDPLGGLAEAIADAVPISRTNEVIYLQPSDLAFPIGFNPLASVPRDLRHLVADHVLAAFMKIWGASLDEAPRLAYLLYNGLRLLLESPGTTLLGLPRLLVDDRYRTRLLDQCEDQVIAGYWLNEFAAYDDKFRTQIISPIQNKVGLLLSPPALRNIIGQPKSTIDIARLMNDGGILIANLAKGKMGATASHLLGAFLATRFAQVAEERASIPPEQRRHFALFLDEFHNFATESFAGTLSESRQWGLSVCAANQYLQQLPDAVRHAIMANAGSFITYRIGAYDAPTMASELGIENERTLSDTANFHAWCKLLQDGSPTDPFLLRTSVPQPPARGRTAAVISRTRARHSRDRSRVEAAVARQLHGSPDRGG